MSQISLREASDLLKKLFDERVRVTGFLISPLGAKSRIEGFISSATREHGLVVSLLAPPELGTAFINVRPFEEGECEFEYGEQRELPDEVRRNLSGKYGESALVMRFLKSTEWFALFFTI